MSKFDDFLASQHQFSDTTKRTYDAAVKAYESVSGASFEDSYLDTDVVHKVLGEMDGQYPASTWNSYVLRLRRLARWLSDPEDEEAPRVWRKVDLKKIDWGRKLKDKWLTEREVWQLLEAADHPRDKALVGVTWEAGFRVGEVIGLRICDCKKRKYGFDLTVSGKTGTRTMQIVLTAPLLEMWLYNHPAKNDPQSPLWIRLARGQWGDRFQSIKPSNADKIIKKLTRRAGIKKKISFHWLRHTQATHYADQEVNESKMRLIFGWVKGSPMADRYTHLTGRSTRKTVLALRGVTKIEEATRTPLMQPRKCLHCGTMNAFDAKHCRNPACDMILDREEAERLMKKEKDRDEAIKLLIEPGMLEALRDVRKRMREKGSL